MDRDREGSGGGGYAPHLPPATNLNVNVFVRLDPAIVTLLEKLITALATGGVTAAEMAALAKTAEGTREKLQAVADKPPPPT